MQNGEASRSNADVKPEGKEAPDWGFEKPRGGLARETKIGLMLVLVVGCAFGFVLYQKSQKTALYTDIAMRHAGDADDATAASDDADALPEETEPVAAEPEGDPFASATPAPRRADRPPDAVREPATGLFDPPATARRTPPPQDNPFDNASEPPRALPRPAARRTAPPTPDDDPAEVAMDGPPDSASPIPPGQDEPADDFGDPFAPAGAGSPPAAAESSGEFVPPVESDAQVAGHEADVPFENLPPPPQPKRADPGSAPRPTPLGPRSDPRFDAAPRPMPRAAMPEDDPFGAAAPRGAPLRPAPAARSLGAGAPIPAAPAPLPDATGAWMGGPARPAPSTTATGRPDPRPTVYEVQPNDNFWRISSKQYGTAKYYLALARYNAERIPDPAKLRPGMKVMIPPPEALEARYPDLFPQRATVAEGAAGFHYGPDGRPMYRVGRSDTLGTIARDHLGRTSRWIQVFEMNRDRLKTPHDLQIGADLRLPLDASSVKVVQTPATIR